ncbi:hypothetical protein QKW60_13585 [Defluviimonas aestuarii]|jgi:hypothetical protein|uniref:DUF6778 family protein n=1 Tax=Albidovulum aestuarii TaxID=1130726 RepID=UPI00249CA978|nr:DUF6778 family protein [Defluviimonas aestuarii]MDI3337446.1 hypothetical protein [Defluviimonas aestuarii]
MRLRDLFIRLSSLLLVVLLAACGGQFRTSYDAPVSSANWRVTDVNVSVPTTLTVSEAEVFVPNADIVWREDPAGDRYAQVAALMENAIRKGAAGAKGSRAVQLDVTMMRFHAMTWKAETQAPAGVHNVEFMITVRDARTGEVLAGPDQIEASLRAMTGAEMAAARGRGETQKSQISAHVARTIAGWLGLGADPRTEFSSVGA